MSSNKSIFIIVSLGVHVCAVILFFYLTTSQPKLYSTIAVSLLELQSAEESSSPNIFSPEAERKVRNEKKEITPPSTMVSPYLLVSQLDIKPQIVRDIDPDLLENFRGVQAQWLNLTLLINEYGDVDRVFIELTSMTSDLPEQLLADLKQRFIEARFTPGRLQNQVVRSQLRIRVYLD
jgi:hypothetical protein